MSCTKCDIEGIYEGNRICFPNVDGFHLRTDLSFRAKDQESHHIETTILENIPGLDMVRSFPLDYMHLVCLGVIKKMLNNLWLCGKPPYRFSSKQTQNISDQCISLKNQIPQEFLRKPRSLSEVKRWKATEFRLFLFYVGPVVLKQNIPEEISGNFLSLHVSMTLLSKALNLEYAQKLLKHFVKTFTILYGKENVSHNVHNLLHLTEDVQTFGSIEKFSPFPYENHMMFIKKLVRKGDKPLQQIVNRISELTNRCLNETEVNIYPKLKSEHSRGPVIENSSLDIKQYEKIHFKTFLLSLDEADNCCVLKDNSIVIIKNIIVHDQQIKIIGKTFLSLENFYTSPCESSKLNIFLTRNLSTELCSFDVNQISFKCIKLNFKNKFVVFPLIHTI